MLGWIVPPPKKPEKTKHEFQQECQKKVEWLINHGFLKSSRIQKAMLHVPREDFIPEGYKDFAYLEIPLILPGANSTISCPHSYPLFYEALELTEGNTFLEVGAGSGYGAALAQEIVGNKGLVVTIEIDPATYAYARSNLEKSGYIDVLLLLGDGALGHPPCAPYDKICITAACPKIPTPLVRQLKTGGKLIAPIGSSAAPQDLLLLEKSPDGTSTTQVIEKVLYVPLQGKYGWPDRF